MTRGPLHNRDADLLPRARLSRRFTVTFLVLTLLLSGGCVMTGPHQWLHNGLKVEAQYGRPDAPVAAEWIQANDPLVESSRLDHGDWWNVFADPTLTILIHLAYE